MQHNGWDHALKVTGDGTGLVGHAGAILLRKAADQAGLTAGLSAALRRAGKSPLLDRGAALVSMAAAIALRGDEHERYRGAGAPGSRAGGGTERPDDTAHPGLAGIAQDGTIEEDKDVAEITGLMSRAGRWPDGLRWIVRRVKPSRRQVKNLTDYEKRTGWRYSITCTNIPVTGIGNVPGSHHPQYIDVVHREHAVVETGGVRTAKAMGLRNLPSKAWQVNRGWVIAANIAADLTAWIRLLGFHDSEDLGEAEPDTLRPTGSGTSPPASRITPASGS
ncbi:MAG TPA: hypothetical protein VMV92_15635 [Streptosporangiaceae bacterium]|nr:hypothetical protein [Streptosporangiaceae bacterium]